MKVKRKKKPTPEEFFASDWSLIDQYLRANPEHYLSKVYGVSALGGTFEELETLNAQSPQERMLLADGSDVSHDLTRPLRWLLNIG